MVIFEFYQNNPRVLKKNIHSLINILKIYSLILIKKILKILSYYNKKFIPKSKTEILIQLMSIFLYLKIINILIKKLNYG